MTAADPKQELADLTFALRRTVERSRAQGRLRTQRAAAPPAAMGSAPPQQAPAPGACDGPQPAAAWPPTWGETPRDGEQIRERATELAARAAACSDLNQLRTTLSACNACGLSQGRSQTVFMDGDHGARVMFVGEAPGFHEDQQGVPFVGNAGQLLTAIVEKGMHLGRSEVAIANVLKCRPPDNRDPLPAEKQLCTHWLDRQIELVDPGILIALGRHAAGHLLGSDESLSRMRGRVWERARRKVVVTYHPAFLLRSPEFMRYLMDVWTPS